MKLVHFPKRPAMRAGHSNSAPAWQKSVCLMLLSWCSTIAFAQAGVLLSTMHGGTASNYTGDPDLSDSFNTGAAALSVTRIDVQWAMGVGGTGNRVGIFLDASGSPSSTQIGTWFTSGTAITTPSAASYTGTAELSASTNYHLVIELVDNSRPSNRSDSDFYADPSTLGASNPLGGAYGDLQSGWYPTDPFNLVWQLHGTALSSPVPEPTTNVIVGLGALGMAIWKRRRLTAARCAQGAG